MQTTVGKIESVIEVAERTATIAELVLASDAVAADSRFVPILSDSEMASSLSECVSEIRHYVAMAKRNINKGMTGSKEIIFCELILGMSQGIMVRLMPGTVSVAIDLMPAI